MIWFTSDTHFGHENAIKFCKRPFLCADEMDDVLVENINKLVDVNDELYHLGDFSDRIKLEQARGIRNRINCKNIHLVKGNHDLNWENESDFIVEPLVKSFNFEKKIKFVCCHYPMMDWLGLRHGSIHLHGHIHSSSEYNLWNRENGDLRFDVGVDANNFKPVSIEQIMDFFDGVDYNSRRNWRDWSEAPTPFIPKRIEK